MNNEVPVTFLNFGLPLLILFLSIIVAIIWSNASDEEKKRQEREKYLEDRDAQWAHDERMAKIRQESRIESKSDSNVTYLRK